MKKIISLLSLVMLIVSSSTMVAEKLTLSKQERLRATAKGLGYASLGALQGYMAYAVGIPVLKNIKDDWNGERNSLTLAEAPVLAAIVINLVGIIWSAYKMGQYSYDSLKRGITGSKDSHELLHVGPVTIRKN